MERISLADIPIARVHGANTMEMETQMPKHLLLPRLVLGVEYEERRIKLGTHDAMEDSLLQHFLCIVEDWMGKDGDIVSRFKNAEHAIMHEAVDLVWDMKIHWNYKDERWEWLRLGEIE